MSSLRIYILILDIFFVFLGGIGIYQLSQKAALPIEFESGSSELRVKKIRGGSDSLSSGVMGTLHSLDGIAVSTLEDIEFFCDGKAIGTPVIACVTSGRDTAFIALLLNSFYSPVYIILSIFQSLLLVIVAIVVILRKPVEDDVAISFHGMMLSIFCITSLTWASYIKPTLEWGIITRIVFSTAYAFVPVFFLWFTLVFPRIQRKASYLPLRLSAIFATIVSIGMGYSIFNAVRHQSSGWFGIYEYWFNICRVFFAVLVLICVYNFVRSYKYAVEESERRKLRWIFFGALIGPLSFVFLWQIPQLFTSTGLIPEEFVLIFASTIPLTFGFSIIKYHIFNIDLLFKRSTVYGAMLLIVLTMYALLVGGFTLLIGSLSVIHSFVISGAASVITAFVFQPLRERVKRFVDKQFFVVQYSFAEAQNNLLDGMKRCATRENLFAFARREIISHIPAHNLIITVNYVTEGGEKVKARFPHPQTPDIDSFPEHWQNGSGLTIFFQEDSIEKGTLHGALPIYYASRQITGKILIVDSKNCCLGEILLGPKKSGFVFSREDIQLLKFAAVQIAAEMHRLDLQTNLENEKMISTQLRELNELKSFFVSSVSHDLKTPLTSIKMFAELMQNSTVSEEKKSEYLMIIQGEADRLTRLINTVLDFAKIEKGIKEYSFSKVNVVSVLNETLRIMEYQLIMNGFTVTKSYEQQEFHIFADRDAVIESCINLISNAIKYSAGTKQLNVSASSNAGELSIRFQDKGIGISPPQLSSIMEPFVRLNEKVTEGSTGTGLGLSIVRHIMEAHNGRIEVESQHGTGSTFSLIFPLNEK